MGRGTCAHRRGDPGGADHRGRGRPGTETAVQAENCGDRGRRGRRRRGHGDRRLARHRQHRGARAGGDDPDGRRHHGHHEADGVSVRDRRARPTSQSELRRLGHGHRGERERGPDGHRRSDDGHRRPVRPPGHGRRGPVLAHRGTGQAVERPVGRRILEPDRRRSGIGHLGAVAAGHGPDQSGQRFADLDHHRHGRRGQPQRRPAGVELRHRLGGHRVWRHRVWRHRVWRHRLGGHRVWGHRVWGHRLGAVGSLVQFGRVELELLVLE